MIYCTSISIVHVKLSPGARIPAPGHCWQVSLKLSLVMQKLSRDVVPSLMIVQTWLIVSPTLARPSASYPSAQVLSTPEISGE